jgi:hypothetical protein
MDIPGVNGVSFSIVAVLNDHANKMLDRKNSVTSRNEERV